MTPHRPQAFQEFQPVDVGHVEVQDDGFDGAAGLAFQHLKGLVGPSTGMGASEAPKDLLEDSALCRIVFDDENADSHAMQTSFKKTVNEPALAGLPRA